MSTKRHSIDLGSRPTHQQINDLVIQHAAIKWKSIGVQLLDDEDYSTLESIGANFPTNNVKCCEEMFAHWLKKDKQATWEKLLGAFKAVDLNKLADDIEKMEKVPVLNNGSVPDVLQKASNVTGPNDEPDGTNQPNAENQVVDGQQNNGVPATASRLGRNDYDVISKKKPLRGVIIGNENFKKSGLTKLNGMATDVEKVKRFLNTYGTHCSEEKDATATQMRDTLKELKECPLSQYSGLIVIIMSHGQEGDILYGSDGDTVPLTELAEIFNSADCEGLRDKPKIFIVNACRGTKEDSVQRQGPQVPQGFRDSTPREADFLFVHSTTPDHTAYMRKTGSPFIEQLVNVLEKDLKTQHLEHALLKVKANVAKDPLYCKGNCYKQMPSVVSQMRYEIRWKK